MNIEDGKQEETNVAENAEDQTNLDAQPEQSAESNIDGGAEDTTAGEETGEVESGVQQEEVSAKPDSLLEISKVIDVKFKALEEKLSKPAEQPQRELTDEEWAPIENKWGVPRTAIKESINVVLRAKSEMKEYVDDLFSEMKKDSIMADVAKQNGISDYKRLEPGVKEFLSKFDPKQHTNPELLKMAFFAAKGMAAPKDIKRIQANDEKNRQVINRVKPGRPDLRPSGVTAQKGLNETQREAAEIMGDEAEYNKIRNNKSRVIAV